MKIKRFNENQNYLTEPFDRESLLNMKLDKNFFTYIIDGLKKICQERNLKIKEHGKTYHIDLGENELRCYFEFFYDLNGEPTLALSVYLDDEPQDIKTFEEFEELLDELTDN